MDSNFNSNENVNKIIYLKGILEIIPLVLYNYIKPLKPLTKFEIPFYPL